MEYSAYSTTNTERDSQGSTNENEVNNEPKITVHTGNAICTYPNFNGQFEFSLVAMEDVLSELVVLQLHDNLDELGRDYRYDKYFILTKTGLGYLSSLNNDTGSLRSIE